MCSNQDILQYTIQYEGKSFSCPWDRKMIYISDHAFFNLFNMLLYMYYLLESDIQQHTHHWNSGLNYIKR